VLGRKKKDSRPAEEVENGPRDTTKSSANSGEKEEIQEKIEATKQKV
jgi:hypothetical protein